MSIQCRMIAKSTGKQCKNNAQPEFAGFCRHHVPIPKHKIKNNLMDKLEKGELIITYTQVIYQLIRLAIPALPELFGDGGSAGAAKKYLSNELIKVPIVPTRSSPIKSGSKVDWNKLKEIYLDIKSMEKEKDQFEMENLNVINDKVDNWFLSLSEDHRTKLFEAIEDFKPRE